MSCRLEHLCAPASASVNFKARLAGWMSFTRYLCIAQKRC